MRIEGAPQPPEAACSARSAQGVGGDSRFEAGSLRVPARRRFGIPCYPYSNINTFSHAPFVCLPPPIIRPIACSFRFVPAAANRSQAEAGRGAAVAPGDGGGLLRRRQRPILGPDRPHVLGALGDQAEDLGGSIDRAGKNGIPAVTYSPGVLF